MEHAGNLGRSTGLGFDTQPLRLRGSERLLASSIAVRAGVSPRNRSVRTACRGGVGAGGLNTPGYPIGPSITHSICAHALDYDFRSFQNELSMVFLESRNPGIPESPNYGVPGIPFTPGWGRQIH